MTDKTDQTAADLDFISECLINELGLRDDIAAAGSTAAQACSVAFLGIAIRTLSIMTPELAHAAFVDGLRVGSKTAEIASRLREEIGN